MAEPVLEDAAAHTPDSLCRHAPPPPRPATLLLPSVQCPCLSAWDWCAWQWLGCHLYLSILFCIMFLPLFGDLLPTLRLAQMPHSAGAPLMILPGESSGTALSAGHTCACRWDAGTIYLDALHPAPDLRAQGALFQQAAALGVSHQAVLRHVLGGAAARAGLPSVPPPAPDSVDLTLFARLPPPRVREPVLAPRVYDVPMWRSAPCRQFS